LSLQTLKEFGTGQAKFKKKKIINHNRNLYPTLNLTFTRRIKRGGYEAGMEEKRLHANFW
jgi:hypothetical protein